MSPLGEREKKSTADAKHPERTYILEKQWPYSGQDIAVYFHNHQETGSLLVMGF